MFPVSTLYAHACRLAVPALFSWLAFVPLAQAAHGPHFTDAIGAVHFNIHDVFMPAFSGVPAGGVLTAGGPCGAAAGFFSCGFLDTAFMPAVANNWAWESAIHNPNPGLLTAKVGFFFPGGPLLGTLTLGAGSTFHLGIVIDDLLHFGELSANTIWYSWAGTVPIFTDAAVVEHTNVLPLGAFFHGDFWFHFHSSPDDAFVVDPTIDISALDFAFRDPATLDDPVLRDLVSSLVPIPLPPAVLLFASALFGVATISGRRPRKLQQL